MLFCISCTDDNGSAQKGERNIRLGITSSVGAVSRTPGDVALNENKVESVYVFFYDETGKDCLYFPPTSSITIGTTDLTIGIPETADAVLDRPLIIYVLANCNLEYSALNNKSLVELQNLVQENGNTFNGEATFIPQDNFLINIRRYMLPQSLQLEMLARMLVQ